MLLKILFTAAAIAAVIAIVFIVQRRASGRNRRD